MYPIRWVCPCVCVQAACKCIRPMHALCYIFLCSLWWGDLSWINFCCFGQLEFSLNLSALEISGWYTLMCAASRTCALVWPLFCRAKYSLPVLLPPMLPHPHAAPPPCCPIAPGGSFALGHLCHYCHCSKEAQHC